MSEEPIHVWFCSPDAAFAQVMARTLGPGFEMRHSTGFDPSHLDGQQDWWDVVLLDLRAIGIETGSDAGVGVLEGINRLDLPPPIIVMLGEDEHSLLLKLMEEGAYDSLASPPDMVELRLLLRRAYKFRQAAKELYLLRSQERTAGRLQELIGSSEVMQRVSALAQKISPCDVNVLITGETGTGKELLARAIHRLSPRANFPFVAFSCASLPETLVEDELFGHEKGAFTGALLARRGRFEVAEQGTLFLDEIGDLSLNLQAKLLRVVQERSFERLGSNAPHMVNIRLVCATHQNLTEMVKRGEFREDLYYRLNVVELPLPPLRERREDVPFLAHHFLRRFASQFGKKTKRFSLPTLHALEEYNWPGNVRELENVMQRAVVMAEGPTIETWHLPGKLSRGCEPPRELHSYEEQVRDFKRRLILRTLRECGYRKTETARTLGMARGYLHRLINQLQIRPEEADSATELLDEPAPSRQVM